MAPVASDHREAAEETGVGQHGTVPVHVSDSSDPRLPRRASSDGTASPRSALRRIELVGLAGVGKSHLKVRLLELLGDRGVDVGAVTASPRWLPQLVGALLDTAPLLWLLLRSQRVTRQQRFRFARATVVHAWRERIIARQASPDCIVVSEEGWFHKLRQLRRFAGPRLSYGSLPGPLRRRIARADLVLFLTAETDVLCARKLRRKGIPVTPETLRRQYLESEALGQWSEHLNTQFDLRQAANEHQVRYEVVDYHESFDFEDDLLPLLVRHGLA